MIPLAPYWAIDQRAAHPLETGLPNLVERLATTTAAALRKKETSIGTTIGNTSIIPVHGILTKNESIYSMLGFGTAMRAISIAIDSALRDEDVERIVLLIDSPGGTVDGVRETVARVRSAKREKPIIAQVDGAALSAAYWIATAATHIYAGPGDEVGSIGVRLMLYDFSKQFEQDGIEAVPIDTGKFKSAGAVGTQITKDQRAYFQEGVDAHFADFRRDVLIGRRAQMLDHIDEISQGGSYIANRGLSLGLIDGIRYSQETIKGARSNAAAKARARMREIEART